eukprot:PITA_11267
MVKTRLQRRKRLLAMAESHAGSSRSPVGTTVELMQKVVERLEYLEDHFEKKIDLVLEEQKAFLKVKDELDELRTQHEYTDLMCTQLELRVKDVEDSRDQGLMEIMDLKKALDEAKDEIAVLKKAVRHSLGGGMPHVKVKEPDSFDGTRSAKTLGNFLWDMEKYLERMDQVSNGSATDITSWDDMKGALQAHFSPQDETWEARMKIKFIKQTGNLQTYQREFASVVLELPDMAERDKVFNFLVGLKPWARNEVKRQRTRTLEEAFASVDRLVEHYDETSDDRKKKSDKPKDKKKEEAN